MRPFAELHHDALPLLLPNAWDVASALMFAEAGFEAVGTTSMGVANSTGLPDGRRGTREATVRLVEALEVVHCHVTADVEDGYSDDPAEVASFVESLPVCGINLEDSLDGRLLDPVVPAAKIAAVKERRPDLYLNARVDTFWFGQDADVEHTVARARRYVAAGADGIFVPGVGDHETIRALAVGIDVPLNVLPVAGASLETLGKLGVRRVSTGSLPYRAALTAAVAAANAVRDGEPLPDAVGYHPLQDALTAYAASPFPPPSWGS
jgi:2-methylisocitrate lyase-like PEP mutase family enzyme